MNNIVSLGCRIFLLLLMATLCGCVGNSEKRSFNNRINLQTAICVNPQDASVMMNSLYMALETGRTGQVFSWFNKQTRNGGEIIPTKVYFNKTGQISRDFIYSVRNNTEKDKTPKHNRLSAVRTETGVWNVIRD